MTTQDTGGSASQSALEFVLAVIVEIAEAAHDSAVLTQASADVSAALQLAQDGADIAALATAAAVLGRRSVTR